MKVKDIFVTQQAQQREEPSAVVNVPPQRPRSPATQPAEQTEEEVDWSQAEAGAGEAEAVTWLRSKLSPGPRQIAPLIAEWCGGEEVRQRDGTLRWEGGREGTNGRWLDDLMAARWTLGVVAYVGEDERMWWRLPQESVQ